MANVLDEEKREQILALGRLGWSLRRIERELNVRRETAGDTLQPVTAVSAAEVYAGWCTNDMPHHDTGCLPLVRVWLIVLAVVAALVPPLGLLVG